MRTKQNLADVFPLTPLQQGILVHALDGGDDPYLLRACFRIEGTVDAAALHRAWQHVVDRHDALRADVEWTKGTQPVLRVFKHCPVALTQLDWSNADNLEARLRALADEEVKQFALQRAADLRVTLIRVAPDRSYLLWVFHHLLLDGWSIANVLAEVLQSYQAALAGRAPDLAPAPAYARYLGWLRARPLDTAEAYWRDALADHAPHEFPPRLPSGAGFAERAILLDEPTSAKLRALAADAKITLATCLHAAHALLIAAYTGHDDVVFGATVAGRPDEAGADAMVGAFINTVPVRVRIPQRGELLPWLAQLHAAAGARVAHEHLGLPRIQELAPARFESILVFESFPVSEVLGQAEALPIAVEQHRLFDEHGGVTAGRGRNNYPLTLVVLPGKRIELIVAYHRARLGDAVAAQLTTRLAAIVHALAERAPLSALRTAGAPAIAPLRHDRTPRLIHERIAQWAQITPEAAAVRCDDVELSYAELDARSDVLAARLEASGVVSGDRVGLALPRGIDFAVALVAVLKTGAAYVPLDREAPRARLVDLVAEAQLAIVLGLDGLHPTALAGATGSPRRPALSPETPAYVIFTSGSTGTPKGVAVSHRALDHYTTSLIARLGPAATTSMAMVSTVAADLGHTSLFGALCAGGTLHLISDERAADPDAFCDYLARHQVASLKIVPGHLWGLMPPATPERALPAHTLIIGGEAASPALLAVLRAQARCRVLNHYGPTETTVGVLTHPLGDDALPLGHPLAHATAHVLGPDLRPLPPGAAGELYLGGASLATGYVQRPQLTAERFLPDPWHPASRLYRTGDRARRRLDGAIEFLGRADDQIKIRGFRIELGEIRAELLRLPGITDARVIARPAGDALQLHAYLVGTRNDVAEALRARLPEPMIPSAFVWLDRFPVTANGKLDVARLPLPEATTTTAEAPATPTEHVFAEIWREVLRCEVARHDNFFHLGGDSILALKVVARARRAGFKLTPKQLFAHPTLAEAARVAQPLEATAPAAPVASVALTPIQHHFLARQVRDPHHFNQAVLLELDAALDLDQLRAALHQLTRHHEALRLRLVRDGARWRPHLADRLDGDPVTHITSLADLTEACSAAQRSLDLARGPLLRAVYFDAASPRLLLFAHHLVTDGVSWRILLEDLADLMRGAALPPPTTPFTAWTARLATHAADLAYWQRIVADLPAPRPAGTVGDAAAESAALDAAQTHALLHVAPRAYDASVHALLLAALTRTLGSTAITVEGHGREDVFDGVDLSRTVGWLATTYPVRLTAHADRRATVRGVVEHLANVPAGGLGYGVLRHLAPGTPLAGAATPDVIFNYLGQFDDSFASQQFRVASESSGQRRSPHTPRDAAFVINAVIYDGTLRIDWEHPRADQAEAAALLAAFTHELRALLAEVI